MIPHTHHGPRHEANYCAEAPILLSDVVRADAISMCDKPAPAPIHTPARLVSRLAHRAGLRGVALVLHDHGHTQSFGLVGEHMPDHPGGHLVDALIARMAHIDALPDVAYVADGDGLHPVFVQGGDKPACNLVRHVLDLVIPPPLLPLLRPDISQAPPLSRHSDPQSMLPVYTVPQALGG